MSRDARSTKFMVIILGAWVGIQIARGELGVAVVLAAAAIFIAADLIGVDDE